jgi:hypothetical protein
MQEQESACRDRRRDQRHALARTLSWRRPHEHDMRAGWTSDTSRSSLSFVTARADEPSFGEIIETSMDDRSTGMFRVTRVATYDERFSLVACCITSRLSQRPE